MARILALDFKRTNLYYKDKCQLDPINSRAERFHLEFHVRTFRLNDAGNMVIVHDPR
jgi:hypothetical protein